ncbi:hypothetical protein ERO13_D10G116400v2 [Gossypium hirsutum]|uniref:Non-specific lipid-transfer protein n=5 Tax=Gossypium TaxID=3633 RepID=Q9M6B7_GOSHI|nr:non-specific lipid-transfer protein [Gossypium raimondii]XP_016698972.1 non-specific lipid-transfer protein-like [Gossypium hirsutum]AFR43284.1 lipid transfer protein precursor [Gossypium barbadense]TYG49950.1 hypothetical protein ES288_D10G135600v1 [Gossypium darwinii]TYH49459.1 hypothetical protein ES332_D10G138300v1 [Gossypium tomentosum]AAF35185.1 lipid transfer protein precursor [Gossypium hirsutum]AFR43282.1 lipid transfer protein precursor [Gossypium raimondii]
MASSMSLKLTCVVVFCMVVGAPLAQGAISCGQITSALAPCIAYLKGNGAGSAPPACCNGIRSLNSAAKTTPDRQAACSCIKSAATGISGINYSTAAGLPGKCGINIPYKISPSTDCKSIK